ncbi:MAG: sulfurtransferase [Anaerolineae bacterium]
MSRSPTSQLISVEELGSALAAPNVAVVDCRFSLDDTERGRRDYGRGHVPGAVYAHLDDDLSDPVAPGVTGRHPLPDVERFSMKLTDWGIGPGVRVVAYDDAGGAIAARLWWLLRWLGHDGVAVLDGGWPRWIELDGRVADGVESPQPADPPFAPRERPDMLVDADAVEDVLGSPDWLLFDARSADRYRGENETIDPVAGHVPGATSRPYADNLMPDGTFRPADELRQLYVEELAGLQPSQVIAYCGSGVTAAHDLLAMAHAGMDGALLYAGSWSEWITDPSRPVATGA